MRAILLAAGEGTRLRPHTASRPKCLVELLGRPLIEYQLAALAAAGVTQLALVTGYRAPQLAVYGEPCFHNMAYAYTNMVGSLMCAARWLDGSDDVLIAYTDIVYEPRIVAAVATSDAELAVAIDRNWRALWQARMEDPLSDAETLRLGPAGEIVEIGNRPRGDHEIEGQYLGIVKVRRDLAPRLVACYRALDGQWRYRGRSAVNLDMTSFLAYLIEQGWSATAVPVAGGWLEVDTVDDLATYERLAETGELAEFWSPGRPLEVPV